VWGLEEGGIVQYRTDSTSNRALSSVPVLGLEGSGCVIIFTDLDPSINEPKKFK
jgi:hypothetical protein